MQHVARLELMRRSLDQVTAAQLRCERRQRRDVLD
jgi:hypothetical protein